MNSGSGGVGVDRDILHEPSHQSDAPAAVGVGGRLRGLPRAGVGDGQPHLVDQYRGAQADHAARTVAVTVLDGVGDGLSGGDEHVHRLVRVQPGPGQPPAQGGASGGEVADVGGKLQLQRGGMAVEQKDNVVLIAAAWRETGHDLVRQFLQCGIAAVLDEGGGAGDAVLQRPTATFDEPVGVEQQRGACAGMVTRASGRDQSARTPSAMVWPSSSIRVVPSASTRTGGGCPALEYTSSPVSGLSTAQTAVVHWAPGSRAAKRSMPAEGGAGAGVFEQQRAAGAAHLPHHGGGGKAMSDAVADDQRDAPVVQVDDVVPVAAHLQGPAGRLIAHREPVR